jgi:hypothetical protein
LLTSFVWYLTSFPLVHAGTGPFSDTATVSATVNPQHVAGATTPPTIPVLYQPEDGTITSNNRRDFIWYQSSDPNGNTITYTLYLNGVATYLGISNLGNSAGQGYTAYLDGNRVKLHPTISLPDGSYNWYVTATDLAGNTSQSATWHLTIDTTTPTITVTDIDTYHHLHLDSSDPATVPPGLNFDVDGPKDVSFTLNTTIYSNVTLQFYNQDNQLVASRTSLSSESGVLHTYQHLDPGSYTIQISAVDQAGQVGALPSFSLTVHQATITLTAPGLPPYSLPYTPYTLASLPATIASLQTSSDLALIITILLAIIVIMLLIFFWSRRPNLVLLDSHHQGVSHATIYHSVPYTPGMKGSHTPGVLSIHQLVPRDHSKLYIHHLGRYSTLTIRTNPTGAQHDSRAYILSLCAKRSFYTVFLG